MRAVALALLAAFVFAAAAEAHSAKAPPPPSFSFGRTGGNIRPLAMTIGVTGIVKVGGVARSTTVTAAKRRALVTLARNQGFFRLGALTACPSTLPDIATLFVTIHAGGKTTTKRVRGNCSKPFNTVYAALMTAAGLNR